MSKITISTKKTIYSKDINKVVDTGFNTVINPNSTTEVVSTIPTVSEFF